MILYEYYYLVMYLIIHKGLSFFDLLAFINESIFLNAKIGVFNYLKVRSL
jgi:hypothetical protein